jgi:hypothetical protein
VAGFFREDCGALRDSLQLEMVAAQYQLRMNGVLSPQGVPVGDAVCAGVIAELERHADPLSHAILRALAHVGTGQTATRSAEAGARLAESGTGLPLAFGDVANARALGAWRESDGDGSGEYAFFADFEHSLGRRHSIALFVEPRHGGVVKHIGLMGPVSDLDPDEPFHPTAMEKLDLAEAGALLEEVLERSFGRHFPDTDDYRVLIAAARARSGFGTPSAASRSAVTSA